MLKGGGSGGRLSKQKMSTIAPKGGGGGGQSEGAHFSASRVGGKGRKYYSPVGFKFMNKFLYLEHNQTL